MTAIQWYPGHIAKAKNKLKEYVGLVDVVIEVFDARLPVSSRYKDLGTLVGNKPTLLLINKTDLADETQTSRFLQDHIEQSYSCIAYNALSRSGADTIIKHVEKLGQPAIDKVVAKGRLPRSVRTMVVGMPNVGKSSVINSLIKRSKVKVASKAGVTRTMQWVQIHPKIDLLDTPGIIYPQIEDQLQAVKLACVSSVGEKTYDDLEIAHQLLILLSERYESQVRDFYHLEASVSMTVENIGKARNWLMKGGQPDIRRTAIHILKDFRQGKMGRYTLENSN